MFACHSAGRVEEVDVILQRSEGGVDSALLYAKTISKYMKDLISYVEKRTSLGKWEMPQIRTIRGQMDRNVKNRNVYMCKYIYVCMYV